MTRSKPSLPETVIRLRDRPFTGAVKSGLTWLKFNGDLFHFEFAVKPKECVDAQFVIARMALD